jgi:hypothetical protein
MKYSVSAALVSTITFVTACGPGQTAITEPPQTPSPVPTLTVERPEPTETSTPLPTPSQEPASLSAPTAQPSLKAVTAEPQLHMIIIRTSALEVNKLRTMGLDIIRLTSTDASQTATTKEDFLKREVVIEAVVTTGLLAKLENMGFDIRQVP